MEQMGSSLIFFALLFAVFYLFFIRPQTKKQKERQRMLSALQKGDDVVTIGGIHGKVVGFKHNEKTVVLKVDSNVNLDFDRTAISYVRGEPSTSEELK